MLDTSLCVTITLALFHPSVPCQWAIVPITRILECLKPMSAVVCNIGGLVVLLIHMVNSLHYRLTIEGSRLYLSDSPSVLVKECSLAQYTCVTCLSVSTSNAWLHFPFQHMWAQTHSHSSHRGFLTNTLIPFNCCVQSPSHCNNVSVQAISDYYYHADIWYLWNHESAFPWI